MYIEPNPRQQTQDFDPKANNLLRKMTPTKHDGQADNGSTLAIA